MISKENIIIAFERGKQDREESVHILIGTPYTTPSYVLAYMAGVEYAELMEVAHCQAYNKLSLAYSVR